jgi:cation diffusion facilitator family transporter
MIARVSAPFSEKHRLDGGVAPEVDCEMLSDNGIVDSPDSAKTLRQTRFAMALSLGAGILMLLGKVGAWLYTGSAAISADAAESVIHVLAVAFAAFSLRLSQRPASPRFLFGFERISFFSAGFEGALIALAAFSVIVSAVLQWIEGIQLANLGAGTAVVAAAAVFNGLLGWYLIRTGKRNHSIILEANGHHVLTDSWTSFGVLAGLVLVLLTGWQPFDPIFAIAAALNILWSGGRLIFRSVGGLLDYADPATGRLLRTHLDELCAELGVQYHGVRYWHTGHRLMVLVHMLFPGQTSLAEAHRIATLVEERLPRLLGQPAEVATHLEPLEDHAGAHRQEHYTGRPES